MIIMQTFKNFLKEQLFCHKTGITKEILVDIASTYDFSFNRYGRNHKSTFWFTKNSQYSRFKILAKALDGETRTNVSINDFGCGYGAFFDYISKHPNFVSGKYYGYDISSNMLRSAKKSIKDKRAEFIYAEEPLHKADYTFASGVFGMKPEITISDDEWKIYVKDTLLKMLDKTDVALAFNMLDIDFDDQKTGLYYSPSEEYEEFINKNTNFHAKVVKGYMPQDWTIIAKKK